MPNAAPIEVRHLALTGAYAISVAALLSALASVYLLACLRRLPIHSRRKFLARQLLHLAVADLVYALSEMQWKAMDFAVLAGWTGTALQDSGASQPLCDVVFTLNVLSHVASLIVEGHLALAFAASALRSTWALDILSRVLPFVWPLAFVLALPGAIFSETYWDGSNRITSCNWAKVEWAELICAIVTLVIAFGSYIVSSWHVHLAGLHVQRSVWMRAQIYLFVSCLFTLPMVAYNVYGVAAPVSDASNVIDWLTYDISYCLYNLRGLLNFIVYVLLSRHSLRLFRTQHDSRQFALDVGFRSEDSFHEVGFFVSRANTSESLIDGPPEAAQQEEPRPTNGSASYFTEMFYGSEVHRGYTPDCIMCMQSMLWSDHCEGWHCSICPGGLSSLGAGRWSCQACSRDICKACGMMAGALGTTLSFESSIKRADSSLIDAGSGQHPPRSLSSNSSGTWSSDAAY